MVKCGGFSCPNNPHPDCGLWCAYCLVMMAKQGINFASIFGNNYKIMSVNLKTTFQNWGVGRGQESLDSHDWEVNIEQTTLSRLSLVLLTDILGSFDFLLRKALSCESHIILIAFDYRSTDQNFTEHSGLPCLNHKPITDHPFSPGVWATLVGQLSSPANPCGEARLYKP